MDNLVKSNRKKREERIEEILTGAYKVFLEKGYSNATMEDIINSTSLSKGGLYHYFKNKEEIFLKILEEYTKQSIDFINNMELKGSNEEILDYFSFKLCEIIVNTNNDDKKIYYMFLLESSSKESFKQFSQEIHDKYMAHVTDKLLSCLNDVDENEFKRKLTFLDDIFHSMDMYSTLFNENNSFKKNIVLLNNLFRFVLSEFY